MRFMERHHLHNIQVQGEAASADMEAAASHPKDLGQMISEDGYTKQQIFNVEEIALIGKRCHLGLS